MHEVVKKIILDIVKLKCNKCGRKSVEPNEHFLDMFIEMLTDYTKWKCLDKHIWSKYTSDNYRKKFHYWVRMGVFDDALDVMQAIINSEFVNEKSLVCFIDGTQIRNINGSYKRNIDENGKTLLGRVYCDKFKRGLKVTVVITNQNYLLDVIISNGASHDISVVPQIRERFTQMHKSNKKHRINIVGDKGYISNVIKKQFAKDKIHYITPNKKNKKQVDEFPWYDKSLLKQRHLIENFFAHIKQFTRIRFLYEKRVEIYKGFFKLAILLRSGEHIPG
jgi:transposase